jgi:endonuclease/exonuclease/phosphatase family metal-dependent hydrolase
MKLLLIFAVLAGTWNLKWFPSGRAEHRASPRVEQANISDAAEVVKTYMRPGKGRILFLQEMRDAAACTNLVAATGDTSLRVVCATAFRDFRDNRLQWQQLGIVSDLPILKTYWKYAQKADGMFVPRGYAYALLDGGKEGKIACFCVHLKSNYGARRAEKKRENMIKREAMIRQVLGAAAKAGAKKVIIAGDFNSDRFQKQFKDEKIFALLDTADFSDGWNGSQANERGTHPGNTRWPDSTLDYVFHKGFDKTAMRTLAPAHPVSDHRLAVFELQ